MGLGYVSLGQSATTLSGGEAQRVKLAGELAKPQTGKTLYILDEPTTGLHADDVGKLLQVLNRLADLGNTIVVVEHQLDVIKSADWVLDLGPEAGEAGGTIVVEGTPEHIAACNESHTGRALKPILARDPYVNRVPFDPKAAAAAELEIDQKAKASEANAPKAKAPWEIDGRAWHTKNRIARNGQPIRWDGGILEHVIDRIEASEGFEPTDWNARTLVKVYREGCPGESNKLFFEAATSLEWIIVLRFSVPEGVFQFRSLSTSLALEPFELSPTPVLSNMYRIAFDSKFPGVDVITITCHSLADVNNKRFNAFLDLAIRAFVGEFDSSRPRMKILNMSEMREALICRFRGRQEPADVEETGVISSGSRRSTFRIARFLRRVRRLAWGACSCYNLIWNAPGGMVVPERHAVGGASKDRDLGTGRAIRVSSPLPSPESPAKQGRRAPVHVQSVERIWYLMAAEKDLFLEEQSMVAMSFGDHLEELRQAHSCALGFGGGGRHYLRSTAEPWFQGHAANAGSRRDRS